MSGAEWIAKKLDPEKAKKAGSEWKCRCPAHADNNPSLYFKDVPGRNNPVFICRSGCTGADIIAELRKRGLWDTSDWDSNEKQAWQVEQEENRRQYDALLAQIKSGNAEAATLAYLNDEVITPSPIVTIDEFQNIDFPPDVPVVGPISKGTINLFGGLSGVGKTLFAHDLAAGASTAGAVAHWRCISPTKTVVIDGEMGGYKMQQRMQAVARKKEYDLITSAMMLLAGQPRLNLFHDREEWLEWLEPYDLVILDNIYTLFPTTNELTANSGEYWEAIAAFLFELKALGKAVVLMDHLNDSGSRLSGTTNKRWGADLVGILWRDPKEPQPRTAAFTLKFGYECGGKVRDEFIPHLHQDTDWMFVNGGFDSSSIG